MASLETIRTITVKGRTEGVDATIAKLKQLSGATNEVAVVSEKTSKSSLSVEQAMERQRRSLDVNYRATQIFNKGQRERDLGLAQGVIGLKEYNRLNGLAKTRFDEMTGAVDKNNNAFERWGLTITRRLIGAYLLTQVRGMVSAIVNLNAELAKTGDVASRIGMSGQGFQGLGTAAAYKGIGGGQFADDMLKFNIQVGRARSGLGELGTLLRANGLSVKDTEDAYFKVADLIARAKGDTEKQFSFLQQAGLPATRDQVRFMEQGAVALRAQAAAARTFTDEQLKQAQDIDERFNKLWVDFTRAGKSAVIDIFDTSKWQITIVPGSPIDNFFKQLKGLQQGLTGTAGTPAPAAPWRDTTLPSGMDAEYNPLSYRSPKAPPVDPAKARELLGIEQQRLSLLGNIASVDEIIAAKNREILLSNTGITDEQRKQILARETILAQSQRLGNQLQFERDQLGRSPIEQQVASRLQGAGVDPASQQGQLYAGQIRLNEQLRIGKELATDFASGFARDMRNGVKASEALGNALGRLADRLMDMAINNLVSAAFSGGTAGGGGFLASLFSFIKHDGGVVGAGGPGRYIHPAYFDDAPRFAMGGMAGIGPDEVPIIAHKDEEVIRRDDPRHRYNGGAGGKGGDTFNYSPTFNDVTPDLLPKIEARLQMYGARWKSEVFSEMKRRRGSDPSFYGS